MNNLVYEDDPHVSSSSYSGKWMKGCALGIQWCPVVLVLLALLFLAVTQVRQEKVVLILGLASVFIFVLVQLRTIATKHQIFSDSIRIGLGWIFHFDIPFSNIENTRATTLKALYGFHRSFIPLYSGDDVVQITRKRGLKINIIPGNRKLFLEHLNKALADWRRSNPS